MGRKCAVWGGQEYNATCTECVCVWETCFCLYGIYSSTYLFSAHQLAIVVCSLGILQVGVTWSLTPYDVIVHTFNNYSVNRYSVCCMCRSTLAHLGQKHFLQAAASIP